MALGWFVRFLVVLVLTRFVWKFLTGLAQGATTRPRGVPAKAVSLVRDPACGTYIDRNRAVTLGHGGETHYFCSEDCRADFKQGRRAASKGV
ncbi:MAG: hypothetical protein O3A25_14960 [Acidobacteria bacterium]|nr:hypothetical protein [Acidobacteriota bacterium]